MTSKVQHLRGTTAGAAPPALLTGELATNLTDARLYYGGASSVQEYPFSKNAAVGTRIFARNTSGLALPSATATTLTGWTTVLDRSGNFNASTGLFTAPLPGFYLFNASVCLGTSLGIGSSLALSYWLNASAQVSTNQVITGLAVANVQCQATVMYQMAAGDTMLVKATQTGIGSGNLNTSGLLTTLQIGMLY